ncbi:Dual-specificity RNA methyltransferase RlmN [Dirofilaria immitis]
MIIQRHAGRARNDYAKRSIIINDENQMMKNKLFRELYWSIKPETSNAVGKSYQIQRAKKGENSERNAIKTSAVNALVKETENEMETSDNDSNNYQVDKAYKRILSMNGLRHKRKSESVRHVIESDMEQSENVTKITVPLYSGKTIEKSIDLSNRNDLNDKNGQDQKLGKQADEAMSGEQNKVYNKMSGEQNGANDRSSRDASSTVSRKRSKSKLLNLSQPHDNRTFSTFAPPDQERLRHEASHIFEGATFRSFDEFEKYFEAYKIVGNNPYRVASSEVLRDGEGKVIERFKYKYIVYHCAHYGNPRKRGGGKRPNQSYLPLGCRARFRLNADTTNGCLRISSFHKDHVNHENNEEDYLRVVSKKRRNLIDNSTPKNRKMGKANAIEKQAVNMSDIRNDTNASRVTERNSIHATSPSENYNLVNSSQEIPASMKIPFPENSTLPISSQQNSAFVPIASSRPAEMSEHNDVAQQILLQSIPLIDPLLQQIPAIQFCKRLQCIEYLIMNAYIIKCGQYLPQEIYLPFIYAVYGADYHLSEWSDEQLKDVMILLSKPAEILLQDDLPSNISINEVKDVRIPQIERAIKAIRAEKLKRCDKIITRFLRYVFTAISQPDFLEAVREFQQFADDIKNMDIKNTELFGVQC